MSRESLTWTRIGGTPIESHNLNMESRTIGFILERAQVTQFLWPK